MVKKDGVMKEEKDFGNSIIGLIAALVLIAFFIFLGTLIGRDYYSRNDRDERIVKLNKKIERQEDIIEQYKRIEREDRYEMYEVQKGAGDVLLETCYVLRKMADSFKEDSLDLQYKQALQLSEKLYRQWKRAEGFHDLSDDR